MILLLKKNCLDSIVEPREANQGQAEKINLSEIILIMDFERGKNVKNVLEKELKYLKKR